MNAKIIVSYIFCLLPQIHRVLGKKLIPYYFDRYTRNVCNDFLSQAKLKGVFAFVMGVFQPKVELNCTAPVSGTLFVITIGI